jgi:hypothetical protein
VTAPKDVWTTAKEKAATKNTSAMVLEALVCLNIFII